MKNKMVEKYEKLKQQQHASYAITLITRQECSRSHWENSYAKGM